MKILNRLSYLASRNKILQKLFYSKTYMFYSMKMIYYKFGWLIKLLKKYLIR